MSFKDGEQPGPFRKHGTSVLSIVFSPDSKLVASAGGGRIPGCDDAIRIWNADSGEEQLICQGHVCGVYQLAFDPRTGFLASASEDYSVVLWNLEKQDAIYLVGGPPIVKGHVAFATAAPLIAIGETEHYEDEVSSIYVINLETGKEVFRHRLVGNDAISAMSFSPDGKRLTFAVQDFHAVGDSIILHYDMPTSKELWRSTLKKTDVRDLHYAAKADAMLVSVYVDTESEECQLGLLDMGSGEWDSLFSAKGINLTTAMSPTENIILCASEAGDVDLFTVPSMEHAKRIASVAEDKAQRYCSATFSPDGKKVLIGDSEGNITVFDR